MQDLGDLVGIRWDFIAMANFVCTNRMLHCDEDRLATVSGTDCSVWIAQEWCRENDCEISFLTNSDDDPCYVDARTAKCDDMARSVDCPALREAGISLRMDVWPATPQPSLFP